MDDVFDIKPGQGVGCLKYGMYRTDVEKLLGEPDLSSREQFTDASGRDLFWSYEYFSLGLTLTFGQEDNYRLGMITVSYGAGRLFGQDVIGLPYDKVRTLLASNGFFTRREERLDIDSLGLVLWFEEGCLDQIQCGYLFDEEQDLPRWPD